MMSFEDFFDGARAQELIDFAKILPENCTAQKKALVQAALKMVSRPEKKEPVYLDYEIMADPCDV